MRNEDDGAALQERALETFLVLPEATVVSNYAHSMSELWAYNVSGRVGVDGGKDIVEEKSRSSTVDGTSERDTSFLTSGQVDTLRTDPRMSRRSRLKGVLDGLE